MDILYRPQLTEEPKEQGVLDFMTPGGYSFELQGSDAVMLTFIAFLIVLAIFYFADRRNRRFSNEQQNLLGIVHMSLKKNTKLTKKIEHELNGKEPNDNTTLRTHLQDLRGDVKYLCQTIEAHVSLPAIQAHKQARVIRTRKIPVKRAKRR